jgi:hypothetical protein
MYRRFGSRVTIVEKMPAIIAREIPRCRAPTSWRNEGIIETGAEDGVEKRGTSS